MTIEEFIEARLTEDEKVARDALEDWEPYFVNGVDVVGAIGGDAYDQAVRHGPPRTLKEIAAKRKALDWFLNDDEMVMWPIICMIAAIWSDHPDYRQEFAS